MSRPTYENDESRANEDRIASLLGAAWRRKLVKLPVQYFVDFAVCDGDRVCGWVEYKRRTVPQSQYPTIVLSLAKYLHLLDLATRTGLAAGFVVEFNDAILMHTCDPSFAGTVRVGGRRDRGDWQDVEPVVHLPIASFVQVKEV